LLTSATEVLGPGATELIFMCLNQSTN
jgi:hypothetical protein